jgi:hypothetical protein
MSALDDDPDLHHLTSPALRDLVRIANNPDFPARLAQIDRLAGCTRPIRLHSRTPPASGAPRPGPADNRLLIACGNRRASCCPSCSAVYAADTYQLIRAGLSGGKTVPDTVAAHPRVFATLTAPSFGPVHHRPDSGAPCRCGTRHEENAPQPGTPLDPASYDYQGVVLFNAHAGRLWAYFTTHLRRSLARAAGLPSSRLRDVLTVAFAKVAEYQKRGAVHFHAVLRLDGPHGPGSTPPAWASVPVLAGAIVQATRTVAVKVGGGGLPPRVLRFGTQLDIQNITTCGQEPGPVTEGAVAAYIAKYATKSATSSGGLDHPIHCHRCRGTGSAIGPARRPGRCRLCHGSGLTCPLDTLPVDARTRRMIQNCWALADHPALAELQLRRWAHALGYRGHLTIKSRTYSTTLTALRDARRHWHTGQDTGADAERPAELPAAHWGYTGRGYTPGEHLLVAHTRTRQALRRQLRHEGEPRP